MEENNRIEKQLMDYAIIKNNLQLLKTIFKNSTIQCFLASI